MPSNLDNILLIKINGEIKHALECTWDRSPPEMRKTPIICDYDRAHVPRFGWSHLRLPVRGSLSFTATVFWFLLSLFRYNFLETCIFFFNALINQIICSSAQTITKMVRKLQTLRTRPRDQEVDIIRAALPLTSQGTCKGSQEMTSRLSYVFYKRR